MIHTSSAKKNRVYNIQYNVPTFNFYCGSLASVYNKSLLKQEYTYTILLIPICTLDTSLTNYVVGNLYNLNIYPVKK